jgi:hypothetical protein
MILSTLHKMLVDQTACLGQANCVDPAGRTGEPEAESPLLVRDLSMLRLILTTVASWALAQMASAQPAFKPAAGITVDPVKKTVSIDAKVAPRKLPHLAETYPIEVIACWGYLKDPKPGEKSGKKSHETVVTIDVLPSDVAKAIESLGLKPGKPAVGVDAKSEGPEVNIFIEVPQGSGEPKRLTMDKFLIDPKTKKGMPKGIKFHYTGSALTKGTPDKPESKYGADTSGTLIMLFPVDADTVFQSSLTMKEEKFLKMEVNKEVLPKEGDPVKLVIAVVEK